MKNIDQHNVNQKEEFKTVGSIKTSKDVVMSVKDCNVFYGEDQALKNINLEVGKSEVIALIGPSGCGKSTFLRCLNRLNDTIIHVVLLENFLLKVKIFIPVTWMLCY